MDTTQINHKIFIDFKPAELKTGKDWIVVYYAKNPITGKLERFRNRVPVHKSVTERKKMAKTMVQNINNEFQNGWTPYLDATNYSYIKIIDAQNEFIRNIQKEIKDSIKRPDTLRAYKSYISVFNSYNKEKTFVLEIKKVFMVRYLDYLYNEKQNSPRTYNNVIAFFTNFFNWCIEKGYLSDNPVKGILRKKKQQKTRITIDSKKDEIFDYLKQNNFGYYTLSLCTYFCFIRRTELTKLKVDSINLKENTIYIDGTISKNSKSESVTIPETLKKALEKHLQKAKVNDFLFSEDWQTGKKPIAPKKISDEWVKVRNILKLPREIQFYSLKDSGITDMFNAGIPNIKIRNQARHYDIKMTEIYTSRNQKADDDILNFK